MALSESPDANRKKAALLLEKESPAPGGWIFFPELFSTGFSKDFQNSGNALEGSDLEKEDDIFYSGLAKKYQAWVLGGGLRRNAGYGHFENAGLLFSPDGDLISHYKKIHPFSFSGEHEAFVSGSKVELVELPGLKLCQTICYDLRFPEIFRAGLSSGAEAFSVIANWPVSRKKHWEVLLQARGIENQAWVFAVNITGKMFGTEYFGGSQIVSPRGECLLPWSEEEGIFSAGIDPGEPAKWRHVFPAIRDRKPKGFF